jgi:hypothetical protein
MHARTFSKTHARTNTYTREYIQESGKFARCCCAPRHQLKVKFQHSNAEMRFVPEAPALMTMERDGGCCNPNKCKLLGCCVCCECCKDGFTLYAGDASQELELNDQFSKVHTFYVCIFRQFISLPL